MTESYSPKYEKRILRDIPGTVGRELVMYPTIASLVEADREVYGDWYAESQKETCQICGITYKQGQYSVCPLCITKKENIQLKKQIKQLEDTLRKRDQLIQEYETNRNTQPEKNEKTIKTMITMGNYKGSPIHWIVIDTDYRNERCLLISEKILEQMQYYDYQQLVTWENSWLRKWLNVNFYDTAFRASEREKILLSDTKDKIYCLSVSEADSYFKKDNMRKAESIHGTPSRWWLRTAGTKSGHVTSVFSTGEIDYEGCKVVNTCGVRPAMWVDINCLR